MKLKSLTPVERPREKLARYGPGKLSNTELLAILLHTGNKKMNVLELAGGILKRFGNGKLHSATLQQLQLVSGLGSAKASEIVACFELGRRMLRGKKARLIMSADAVWKALKDIRSHKKEHFVVFFLDTRNQEIRRELISVGTLNANLVHPREVFEPAISHAAAQVIVAHNHPSGDPEPSEQDIAITKRLAHAGVILGIDLLDHVIVSDAGFVSLKSRKAL
ncbi:MAG: DNA repair protein RadC [Candidatus Sungbacteria bacterium]|nr:DNA repair protein RadC [Candidatus Sungbacteria bacterium]